MKTSDRIRRAIFKISAEGATLFEWSIWSTLLTFLVGLPVVTSVLQSLGTGLIISIITGVILFLISFVTLSITDNLLKWWPFQVSREELEFEENYEPRIPDDE